MLLNLNGQKILQDRVGAWPFSGKILKISPFSEVFWPKIFCLAFCDHCCKFGRILALFAWYHIPEFEYSQCHHLHSHKHASLTDSRNYPG